MKRRLLHFVSLALALIVASTLLAALFFRLAPVDPANWHVDPLTIKRPTTDNFVLLRPGEAAAAPSFDTDPAALAARILEVARRMPRTELLAGSPEERHMTFIVRSRLLGFPDFVTVKTLVAEGGATVALFSRSQYGYSDFGVNGTRVERWLETLDAGFER